LSKLLQNFGNCQLQCGTHNVALSLAELVPNSFRGTLVSTNLGLEFVCTQCAIYFLAFYRHFLLSNLLQNFSNCQLQCGQMHTDDNTQAKYFFIRGDPYETEKVTDVEVKKPIQI